MEVCNGSLQWKFAMEVCNASVQWKLESHKVEVVDPYGLPYTPFIIFIDTFTYCPLYVNWPQVLWGKCPDPFFLGMAAGITGIILA